MKNILLFCFFVFIFQVSNAQIQPFIPDTFEDGTTQGWINGANSPNPPTNIPTGGPLGADDNFLEEVSSGVGMQGSRWIVFNNDPKWLGDYFSNLIFEINFDVKNAGNSDLHFRVAFEGLATQIVTTEAIVIPTSQTDWTNVLIPIVDPSLFTVISGDADIQDVFQNVEEIRIISSVAPSFVGDQIDAVGHLDNIQATTDVGFVDFESQIVSLYPNPAHNYLTIDTEVPLQSITIFNVLGSQMLQIQASGLQNQVDLSSFDAGVYFVQISSGNSQKRYKIVKN